MCPWFSQKSQYTPSDTKGFTRGRAYSLTMVRPLVVLRVCLGVRLWCVAYIYQTNISNYKAIKRIHLPEGTGHNIINKLTQHLHEIKSRILYLLGSFNWVTQTRIGDRVSHTLVIRLLTHGCSHVGRTYSLIGCCVFRAFRSYAFIKCLYLCSKD